MARKQIDWEAIEKEYRMGQKSVRAIADEFKVSHTAINRRAKKHDWVQDKSKEIKEKTQAALVGFHGDVSTKVSTPTREDIDRAVKTNVEVIRGHRKDIQKSRGLVDLLSTQLIEAANNRDELEGEIHEETKGVGDDKPNFKRRNMMLKAVSLPAHAGILRDLSTALKNLIPLERQAFNLDASAGDEDAPESIKINFKK